MLNACSKKSGFTLVEALVVVAIVGILSGLGVASLRDAVANSRIKDAGINVTAFMERAANESTRLNEKLCVVASGADIKTYRAECSETAKIVNANLIDQMTLEAGSKFVTGKACPDLTESKTNALTRMTLTPKIGVSPIPSGCFMVRYGSTDKYAVSVKSPKKFAMYYKLNYDGGAAGSWFEF